MSTYAELDLLLQWRDSGRFALDMRFHLPDSDVETRPLQGPSSDIVFNHEALLARSLDAEAYGCELGAQVFAEPAVRLAFARCRSATEAQGLALRVRLHIAPNAYPLHLLRWECLRDPESGALLFAGERVLFSRYLDSPSWQPVRRRARGELRAVVLIANPSDAPDYGLTLIDVDSERWHVEASLSLQSTAVLAGPGQATLPRLVASLRHGCDILYIICHGALISDRHWLFLEDDAGLLARVDSEELIARFSELIQLPRLVVLAACEGAGDGAAFSLTSIGARLAESGIPAVLAMQSTISAETAASFGAVFFAELRRDGQIDRAVALARSAVRERFDFWAPTLFTRLRSGQLWYTPGFTDERQNFVKWPALCRSILEGRCTPILGFGLLEKLLGTSRDIARRWADTYDFPLSATDRDDLPQVAQYLAVKQDQDFMRSELRKTIQQELIRRFGVSLSQTYYDEHTSLAAIFAEASALLADHGPDEPHQVLANLPFPLYITTNADSLLDTALLRAGKQPRMVMCPWNDFIDHDLSLYTGEPTASCPLVYRLFGHFSHTDSLVITEDDYFNYLIGLTGNKDLVPRVVRYRLTETALLFLGFRLDDWNFRVLFRSFMRADVRNRRRRSTHVAVQITLDDADALQPEQARRYLESYFGDADVSIYWGSTEDFIRDLAQQLRRTT